MQVNVPNTSRVCVRGRWASDFQDPISSWRTVLQAWGCLQLGQYSESTLINTSEVQSTHVPLAKVSFRTVGIEINCRGGYAERNIPRPLRPVAIYLKCDGSKADHFPAPEMIYAQPEMPFTVLATRLELFSS